MRLPSIKTLAAVFSDPKTARKILEMPRSELLALPAGHERAAECFHPPKTYDLRMYCLNALDSGLFGVGNIHSAGDEYADYLNVGDSYTPTLIHWRGEYRVQSVGDFVETMARQNVRFN